MTPKTFVVPLDGSEFAERALPVAQSLAERVGGRLLLVSAQHYGPLEPTEYLEACARRTAGVPVEIVGTKTTYPVAALVEVVDGDEDRVLCMTTHGRGRLRWAALGSVAEEVIRRAGRPILLVGQHCRADFLARSSHLLACSDGLEGSQELAAAAGDWSASLGLDVNVAVVTHPLDVENSEHPDELLDLVSAPFGGSDHVRSALLRSSYVPGALADFAEELPAALVAINCRARHGLARVALGSVTMGVVHLAPCPLLVTHHMTDAAGHD